MDDHFRMGTQIDIMAFRACVCVQIHDDDDDGKLKMNRHWKHQPYKMMPMAIWFIVPAIFYITDVREIFMWNTFLQIFFVCLLLLIAQTYGQ